MPLTKKGAKIKKKMREEYGEEEGERVFYASERSGRIKGVAKKKPHAGSKRGSKR